MRIIVRIIVCAFALWLTTLIVGGSGDHGVWVEPYADDSSARVMSFLLVALIFGIVNATLGTVIRIVSIPLRILTLGLFGLIINGFLLLVVAWFANAIGWGLHVDTFWWGVLGALVLSILSGIMNGILGTGKRADRDR